MLQKKDINITQVFVANITFYGSLLYMKFTIVDGETSYDLLWKGRISRSEEKGHHQETFDFTNFFDKKPFDEVIKMKDGYVETVGSEQLSQKYKLNENGDKIIPDTDINYVFYIAEAVSSYSQEGSDNSEESMADISFLFPKNEDNAVKIRDEIGREVESRLLEFSETEKRRIQDAIIRYIRE